MQRFVYPLFVILFVCLFSVPSFAAPNNNDAAFYRVPIHSRAQVDLLAAAGVQIRHRLREGVVLRLDEKQRIRLESLGFAPTYLPRDPALPSNESLRAETWHDNSGVGSVLDAIATAHPAIARRFTLGTSVQGRSIHGLVMSDNVNSNENEPEVRIAGCHHGNEYMSVEIPLLFAQYLADNYGTNSTVTDLVNGLEITFIPLVNPDGRAYGQRENANDIDLNRNYGYQYRGGDWSGDYDNSGAFSQPEVRAFADHHLERNFVLSLSFHTTADYVNYLWNYTYRASPDEAYLITLSDLFAAPTGYTTINGYDWYQTYGDTNDFSYGSRGDLDWTIETENINISGTYAKNQAAILALLARARDGVHGVVTDADTGDPLHAMILADSPHWPVYTDPIAGDYHRLLPTGSYDFTVWSPGYEAQRITSVTLSEDPERGLQATRNVQLVPGGGYYALQTPAVEADMSNLTESVAALGPPDEAAFSLSQHGFAVLDMWVDMENGVGNELTVYEGAPYNGDPYRVSVSNDYTGPWTYLGDASGDAFFDLAAIGTETVRYVKIQDRSSSSSGSYPGFDLDAVEYHPPSATDGDVDGDLDDEDEGEQENTEDGDLEFTESDGDLEESTENDIDVTEQDIAEADLDLSPDGDEDTYPDGDNDACGPRFSCYRLTLLHDDLCRETISQGIFDIVSCNETILQVCGICKDTPTSLVFTHSGDDRFEDDMGCTLEWDASEQAYALNGVCGLGYYDSAWLEEADCNRLEGGVSCESHCEGCSDGDFEAADTPVDDGDDSIDGDEPGDDDLSIDGDSLNDDDDSDEGDDGGSGSGDSGCSSSPSGGNAAFTWLLPLLVWGILRRRKTRLVS